MEEKEEKGREMRAVRGLNRELWRMYRQEEPVDQQKRLSEYTVKPDKKAAKVVKKTQLVLDFLHKSDPSKAEKYTSQLASILNPDPSPPPPHFDPMFLKDYYRLMTDEDYRNRRKTAWEQYLPQQIGDKPT